jgi:chromosome segregation ATPase
MTRDTPITLDEVLSAARAILAEGTPPTIDAVRQSLGNRGSRTTIHKYLRDAFWPDIAAHLRKAPTPELDAVPTPIANAFVAVWNQSCEAAQHQANHAVESALAAAQRRENTATEAIARARTEADDYRQQMEAAEARAKEAWHARGDAVAAAEQVAAQHATTQQELLKAQRTLQQTDALLQESRQQREDLAALLSEQQAAHTTRETHLLSEHANALQQTKAEHTAELQRWMLELDRARTQATETVRPLERKVAELQQQITTLQGRLHEQQTAHSVLRESYDMVRKEAVQMRERMTEIAEQRDLAQAEIRRLLPMTSYDYIESLVASRLATQRTADASEPASEPDAP